MTSHSNGNSGPGALPEKNGKRRSVLITGGAGFVGGNLCRTLLKKGDTVYAVDNLITGRKENVEPFSGDKNFHFLELDINDPDFGRTFEDIKIDEIYHLACPTGVPNIFLLGWEMMKTSSMGTESVLELAKKHGSKVVFTSSCEVYGQPEITPQHEEYTGNVDTLGPRSPYEEGKRFGETLMGYYASKYGVEAKIVRIFNTYGPGMSLEDQRVVPQFLRATLAGEDLPVYGNGEQSRPCLYVDDLVKGIILVLKKGKAGKVYNVGSSTPTTIIELAQLVLRLTKSENKISFRPHFIEDHNHRQPSVEKVTALGWKQTVSLEDGLKRMMAHYGIRPATKRRQKLKV